MERPFCLSYRPSNKIHSPFTIHDLPLLLRRRRRRRWASHLRRLFSFLGLGSRMAFEHSRRRKLTQFVSDHVLRNVDRNIPLAVMHANRQSFDSPISHNHLLRTLVSARLVSARRLSPWRHRIATAGSFAFAAAVWMVHRIHRYAANVRPDSPPARASRFTQRNVFMFDVADLAHSRAAFNRNAPHFARRHAQLSVIAFLRQQLRKRSGRPRHLSAFAWSQLDVVNLRAQRNVSNRQSI